jgi:uncharacterized OB-fold protein
MEASKQVDKQADKPIEPEMVMNGKIKCGHCGSWYRTDSERCPFCGRLHEPLQGLHAP